MPQVKRIFTSKVSYQDAEQQAASQGFVPIGRAVNRKLFVVFARQA